MKAYTTMCQMKANTTLCQMKYEPDEVGPGSSGFDRFFPSGKLIWASLFIFFFRRVSLPYWRFICWWSKFTPSLPSSQILTFFLADYFCSGSLESIAVVIKKGPVQKTTTVAASNHTGHKTRDSPFTYWPKAIVIFKAPKPKP